MGGLGRTRKFCCSHRHFHDGTPPRGVRNVQPPIQAGQPSAVRHQAVDQRQGICRLSPAGTRPRRRDARGSRFRPWRIRVRQAASAVRRGPWALISRRGMRRPTHGQRSDLLAQPLRRAGQQLRLLLGSSRAALTMRRLRCVLRRSTGAPCFSARRGIPAADSRALRSSSASLLLAYARSALALSVGRKPVRRRSCPRARRVPS